MADDLRSAATAWAALDPDPETAEAVRAAMARGDEVSLRAWFGGRIEFGTAGLRAGMAPGPTGMNRLVVRQTTAGLVRWLAERAPQPSLVVGYDARHRLTDVTHQVCTISSGHACSSTTTLGSDSYAYDDNN